jgi:5-formyltetrahydrofolate cyclo-ligase
MDSKDKKEMRKEIWDILEDNKISIPPKPSHGRIPNFKGSATASRKLRNTDEWKNARVIFSSPDSAQKKVREFALMDGKTLIMASPKLVSGYLYLDPSNIKGHEKLASTLKGAFRYGRTVEKFLNVDLVVEGSVAVDRHGNRLGKGGSYGDMEISHLLEEKAIKTSTPIVTTVHEIQIVGRVPIENHDQKINMIVTPQRIIRIGGENNH